MNSYRYSLVTGATPKEIFNLLLDVKSWWSGIYGETITGESLKEGDEFSFSAGGGMHKSRQKLVEVKPYSRIVWQVVESDLSFLEHPEEWEGTKLVFDVREVSAGKTSIEFTHEGLEPAIECYDQCSSAWSRYFLKLEESLKNIQSSLIR